MKKGILIHNRYIADHLRRYSLVFYGVLIIGLFNSLVTFLLPVSVGEFFTLFYHTGSTKGEFLHLIGIQLSALSQFWLFFMILLMAKGILTFAENYGTFRQGELFARDTREKVFTAQMAWSMSAMPGHSAGKYLLRYSNDMKSIQLFLTKGVIEGIRSTLFLVIGLVVLFRIHWGLTLTILALLAGVMLCIYLFAGHQTAFIMTSRSARSRLLAYVSRQFSRFRKLKERQLERVSIAGFVEKSTSLYDANMKYNRTESIILALVPVLIFAITGIVLWSLVFLKGTITASEGLMFVLILLLMEGGMRQLLKVPTYINKGKISLYKIDKLILEPGPLPNRHQDILLKAS